MLWTHVEVCGVFCLAAMRNKICYQTIKEKPSHQGLKRKISRLVFKLFPGKAFTLSKYSPVTWHYSPATAILNETTEEHIIMSSPYSMHGFSFSCYSVFLSTVVWKGLRRNYFNHWPECFFKDVNESYITSWCCVVKYWKKLPW